MVKLILIAFTIFFGTQSVHADDLSFSLLNQEYKEYSNIEYKGSPIYGGQGGSQTASKICFMMGYSRLESFSGKEIKISKHNSAYWSAYGGIGHYTPRLVLIQPDSWSYVFKFSKIICAR